MTKAHLECIPVIDTATESRLVGLLHYGDLLREYNEALLHMQNLEQGKKASEGSL